MDRFVIRGQKRSYNNGAAEHVLRASKKVTLHPGNDHEGIKEEEAEGGADFAEFSHPVPWHKVEAEGLDCDYALLFPEEEADHLFKKLEEEVVYLTGDEAQVQVFGKVYNVPRKQATYGDEGLIYTYSGVKHLARKWTPTLEYVLNAVSKTTGHTFNFVLVNR